MAKGGQTAAAMEHSYDVLYGPLQGIKTVFCACVNCGDVVVFFIK